MLSLNQLPQAMHLRENTVNSPTRLSLLHSLLFSHSASLVHMAVKLLSVSQPTETQFYVILKPIKLIGIVWCKYLYMIMYSNDSTLCVG